MAIFEWKDSYCVGIREMDEQHKVLVRIINELDDTLKQDFSVSQARTLFSELLDYTKYHFATEERLMKIGGYKATALDAHLKQHYQFIDEIHSLNNDNIPLSRAEAELVMSYLTNWLRNHILKVDRQLANYLLSQDKPLPAGAELLVPVDDLESDYQSLGTLISELRRSCTSECETAGVMPAQVAESISEARSLLRDSSALIEQISKTLSGLER